LVGAGVPVGDNEGVAEGLGLGTGESVGDEVGAVGAIEALGDADGGTSISSVLTPNPVSFSAPRDEPRRNDAKINAFNFIMLCGNQSKFRDSAQSWKQINH
jgi:hypothetical protein